MLLAFPIPVHADGRFLLGPSCKKQKKCVVQWNLKIRALSFDHRISAVNSKQARITVNPENVSIECALDPVTMVNKDAKRKPSTTPRLPHPLNWESATTVNARIHKF